MRSAAPFYTLLILLLSVSRIVSAPPVVRVITVPEARSVIEAIRTSSEIHVLFESLSGKPAYSSSKDGGKTFTPPVSIVTEGNFPKGLAFDVWDMAVDSVGVVHVALGSNAWKLKLPQNEWGFFYTRLKPGAKAFEQLRNINQKPSEGFSLGVDP